MIFKSVNSGHGHKTDLRKYIYIYLGYKFLPNEKARGEGRKKTPCADI